MSDNTYKVEYSKTARAKCKNSKCKAEIDKGDLRIGKQYPSDRFTDGGTAMDWFHAKCIFDSQRRARKTTKKIDDIDDLEGFDQLKDKDQKSLKELFKEQKELLLKKPKSKSKPKAPKNKKPAASSAWVVDNSDDDDNDNNKSSTKDKKLIGDDELDNGKSISSSKKNKLGDDEDMDDLLSYTFTKKSNNNNKTTTTTTSTNNKSTNTPIKKKQKPLNQILSPKWFEGLENQITSKSNFDSFINDSKTLPRRSEDIFLALNLIESPRDCKVVILGSAPFRNRESASGLSHCDDASKHWQLNCKVPTKNLIKQAMISKGYASKDDQLDTLREILGEVDLPGDSPKDWFKSVARQGVMWLNQSLTCTEGQESIDEHIEFWNPIIEDILRSVFNSYIDDISNSQTLIQNPIPGVVFVLFGKNNASLKEKIESIHSEFMGAVPIDFIEGQSPILESFNNYDYFNQINRLLQKLNQTAIDWWKPKPEHSDDTSGEEEEEEEIEEKSEEKETKNVKNNNIKVDNDDDSIECKSSPKVKSVSSKSSGTSKPLYNFNPDDYECYLIKEDGIKFQIEPGNAITIGRKNLDIKDTAVSRRHADVRFENTTTDHYLELISIGINSINKCLPGDQYEEFVHQVPNKLYNGDKILLCNKKYLFTLEILNKNNPNENTNYVKHPQQTKPQQSQFTSIFEDFNEDDDDNDNSTNNKRKLDDTDQSGSNSSSMMNDNTLSQSSKSSSQKPKLTNSPKTPTTKKPVPPKSTTKAKPTPKKAKKPPKDKDSNSDDDDFIVDDSDEDYHSVGGSDNDEDVYVSIPTRQNDKPDCRYWDLCYRKNPQHLADFRHPH